MKKMIYQPVTRLVLLVFSLLLILPASVAAQQAQISISGTVVDQSGLALPGAYVAVVGLQRGVSTDQEGKFVISVPQNATISVSFVGYKTVEIPVGDRRVFEITLEEDALLLEDVVVIGYGVQRKSDVTGAIAKINTTDIENRSVARVEEALQGKTAGVQIITTSGAPGKGMDIRVRGISSNSGSVDPIILVDGLQVSDIGYLDPNNIESIEVLKDAASAAIYGAQAGNGAVLVTTRSGKRAGEGSFFYDFQYVLNDLAKIPEVMNASQYMDYMVEAGTFTQAEFDQKYDGVTDTNWADVAFETSLMQRHSLGFQGGNERDNFFASINYLDQNGIVAGDADVYHRLTGQINADYKIKKWLRIGVTTSLEKWDSRSVSESSEYGSLLAAVLAMDPLTPNLYSPSQLPQFMKNNQNDPDWVALYNDYLKNESGDYYGVSQFVTSEQVHPMIMRDATQSDSWGANVLGTVYADFTPIKGLTITSKLGYRLGYNNSKTYGGLYYANDMVYRSKMTLSRSSGNNIYYQWENFANYDVELNSHRINFMAGISFAESRNDYTSAGTDKLTKDLPLFRDISYSDPTANRTIGGGFGRSAKMSYFGRVSYSYLDKYLLQAVLRRDAFDASVLPVEKRWGTFPSVSAGWVISKEGFMENNKVLTYLKLRASWGQNGNIGPLGGFRYRTSIASGYTYPYYNEIAYNIGSAPTGLTNPDIRWETSEQIDIGIDLRMFNDRLTFTADFFSKETKDLLVATTPPYETGVSSTTVNAGNVHNHGFEFDLGFTGRIGDFNYNIRGNLSTITNKVTYLDPSISRISGGSYHTYSGLTAFEVGYPVWYMRGYQLDHIDSKTGDPVFVDNNGDGLINDDDKVMIGSALPDFTYGITLNMSWKGLDLTLFGTGSQGNDIFSLLNRVDRPQGNKLALFYQERWTSSNTNARYPRPGGGDQDKFWTSDANVFDGSYFKIKQIQLGYSLPHKWMRKIAVNSLRFYVSLDDWFCFTTYPGMDPEAASYGSTYGMGLDKGAYPLSKKTMFGLNITF